MSALPFPAQRARQAPAATQRPQLRLVPPPARTARWLAALVLATALGVVGVVAVNALAAEAAFDAAALEAEVDALAVRYDELTAEVAQLESPERVRQVALDELGMVPAQQPSYLVVDDAVPASARIDGEAPTGDAAVADPVKPALGARR